MISTIFSLTYKVVPAQALLNVGPHGVLHRTFCTKITVNITEFN